jgi:hypothetical protein
LNIRSTRTFFAKNNVVALKADKDKMPEVDPLLRRLGNKAQAIPFYAVYGPGLEEPIAFGGNLLTASQVRTVVQQAQDAAPGTAAGSGNNMAKSESQ